MEDEDRPVLLDIWLSASRAGHGFLGEEVLQDQLPKVRDIYLTHAQNLVAEDEVRIAGFMGLLGAHIGGLFVAPSEHRKGIGRLLVEEAAARHGELTVEVYEQNESGIAFYRSCGFEEVGRKDVDDEGRPLPLLRMRRLAAEKMAPRA